MYKLGCTDCTVQSAPTECAIMRKMYFSRSVYILWVYIHWERL